MSSDVRLKSLTVQAFRGIRDRATFDLDASTVILTGPNGTGKTSVFDALQWVFLDSLVRLEVLRARRNVEHIVNSYCPKDRASVAVTLCVDDDEIVVQRRGDRNGSSAEISLPTEKPLFGEAAEEWLRETLMPHQPDALGTAMTTSGLLQQDVMRSILEAKPVERYAHISAVLGLEVLEMFEEHVMATAKDAAERRKMAEADVAEAHQIVDRATSRLETLEQRAIGRASVELARAAIQNLLTNQPKGLEIDFPEELNRENASSLIQASRHLREQIAESRDVAQDLRSSRSALGVEPTKDALEALERSVHEAGVNQRNAEEAVQSVSERLSTAEDTSQQVVRLAAAAIPLLGEDCPVCHQPIDPHAVEAHLQELAADTSSLIELQRAEVDARDKLATAQDKELEAIANLSSVRSVCESWDRLRQHEATLAARLKELDTVGVGPFSIRGFADSEPDRSARILVDFLDRLAVALERYVDALSDILTSGHIERGRSELKTSQQMLDDRSKRLKETAQRAARLKQLVDATTQARVEVTANRFAAIEPLVGDIYSRLDPHPSFKLIGFEHSIYRGRGSSTPVVSDVAAGIEADPLIVFSASQANIAALSYFLAMSLGAGKRGLPFVLLDDPLQSMDDVNVLGFADLCRFVRSQRQLIVSTHDRRFANLLHRKLAPRQEDDRTLIHRFKSWDRRGPQVETELLQYRQRDAQLRLLTDVS